MNTLPTENYANIRPSEVYANIRPSEVYANILPSEVCVIPQTCRRSARDPYFLKLGKIIKQCLVDVVQERPADPIEFIAKWLYHYTDTRQYFHDKRKIESSLQKKKEEEENKEQMRRYRLNVIHQNIVECKHLLKIPLELLKSFEPDHLDLDFYDAIKDTGRASTKSTIHTESPPSEISSERRSKKGSKRHKQLLPWATSVVAFNKFKRDGSKTNQFRQTASGQWQIIEEGDDEYQDDDDKNTPRMGSKTLRMKRRAKLWKGAKAASVYVSRTMRDVKARSSRVQAMLDARAMSLKGKEEMKHKHFFYDGHSPSDVHGTSDADPSFATSISDVSVDDFEVQKEIGDPSKEPGKDESKTSLKRVPSVGGNESKTSLRSKRVSSIRNNESKTSLKRVSSIRRKSSAKSLAVESKTSQDSLGSSYDPSPWKRLSLYSGESFKSKGSYGSRGTRDSSGTSQGRALQFVGRVGVMVAKGKKKKKKTSLDRGSQSETDTQSFASSATTTRSRVSLKETKATSQDEIERASIKELIQEAPGNEDSEEEDSDEGYNMFDDNPFLNFKRTGRASVNDQSNLKEGDEGESTVHGSGYYGKLSEVDSADLKPSEDGTSGSDADLRGPSSSLITTIPQGNFEKKHLSSPSLRSLIGLKQQSSKQLSRKKRAEKSNQELQDDMPVNEESAPVDDDPESDLDSAGPRSADEENFEKTHVSKTSLTGSGRFVRKKSSRKSLSSKRSAEKRSSRKLSLRRQRSKNDGAVSGSDSSLGIEEINEEEGSEDDYTGSDSAGVSGRERSKPDASGPKSNIPRRKSRFGKRERSKHDVSEPNSDLPRVSKGAQRRERSKSIVPDSNPDLPKGLKEKGKSSERQEQQQQYGKMMPKGRKTKLRSHDSDRPRTPRKEGTTKFASESASDILNEDEDEEGEDDFSSLAESSSRESLGDEPAFKKSEKDTGADSKAKYYANRKQSLAPHKIKGKFLRRSFRRQSISSDKPSEHTSVSTPPIEPVMARWKLIRQRLVCVHPTLGKIGARFKRKAQKHVPESWDSNPCHLLHDMEIYNVCDTEESLAKSELFSPNDSEESLIILPPTIPLSQWKKKKEPDMSGGSVESNTTIALSQRRKKRELDMSGGSVGSNTTSKIIESDNNSESQMGESVVSNRRTSKFYQSAIKHTSKSGEYFGGYHRTSVPSVGENEGQDKHSAKKVIKKMKFQTISKAIIGLNRGWKK